MKSEQWFTLWIALISVVGGGLAAIISVWAGASLALRGNRRSLRHERALTAAERCLASVDQTAGEYHRLRLIISPDSEHMDTSSQRIIDPIMEAYDKFVESEVGHEAWLLENRTLTFAIAECLHESMQLHLDSFVIGSGELLERIDGLSLQLRGVGDMLRATILDKRVEELTDRDRYVIRALLPGRHIRKQDSA